MRLSACLPAIALMMMNAVGGFAFAYRSPPGADVVAVAFPPWWSDARVFGAVSSASASVVRETAFSSMLVIKLSPVDGLSRLRQSGVWLTLDPQAVAACLRSTS